MPSFPPLKSEIHLEAKFIRVRCYSGFKGDERPAAILLEEQSHTIVKIEDRWYSPGASFFRVRLENGDRYILRHVEAEDSWTLEAYRAGARAFVDNHLHGRIVSD